MNVRYDRLLVKLQRLQAKYERDVRALLRHAVSQDDATDRAILKHLPPPVTPTGRKPMSSAMRRAISKRMKAMWRAKGKGLDKGVKHAA